MTRLFIIRHGNTFRPDELSRRIGCRTDLPLVASGHRQAEALGDWFRDRQLRFSQVLTAGLARARMTAAIIVAKQPYRVDLTRAEWLDEIDHGPDEGQPEAAVLARLGAEALDAWDRRALPPEGWIVEAEARIAAWGRLLDDPGLGDVLAVTSGGAARFALMALPAGTPLPPSLKQRTGAMGEIIVESRGAARLACWDRRPSD